MIVPHHNKKRTMSTPHSRAKRIAAYVLLASCCAKRQCALKPTPVSALTSRLQQLGAAARARGRFGSVDGIDESDAGFRALLEAVKWNRYSCFWHILRGWLKGVRCREVFLATY